MTLSKIYTFSLLVSLNSRSDNSHGTSEGGFELTFPSTQASVHIPQEASGDSESQEQKGPLAFSELPV
ncbi:hypothetical protein BT96DRAFT_922835 [Gymnopus androsaceus JB14]|uniref:Uncharacterized protein n=1 Tax=Gymnopus androsaceus JB14 TaxID=1447944 RepID=A0A6A4HBD6_9AGAR|nr:hypothetical protein BT96DRAFT_922835 [Gymnopus androsaceus JB14]